MWETGNGSEYDVCLSFAGEQRHYVDQVAACLQAAGVRLFSDGYETAAMWGQDLVQRLDEVFRGQARFCVMFVSAEYAAKVWTSHERRSAQARAVRSASTYILPVRFDETEIPGLHDSIVHLNAAELTPRRLADLITEKIREDAPARTPARTTANRVVTSQLHGMAPVVGRDHLLNVLSDGFSGATRTAAVPRYGCSPASAASGKRVSLARTGYGTTTVTTSSGGSDPRRPNWRWRTSANCWSLSAFRTCNGLRDRFSLPTCCWRTSGAAGFWCSTTCHSSRHCAASSRLRGLAT
jgi:hypothetical protein